MRESWRPRRADRVIRRPRQQEISPVRLTITGRKVPSRALASPLIIIYGFAALITIGTLLLLLPFTHHQEGFAPFTVALFTATSAVTVTGLVVEETASYWTRTGQVFILGLMFVGGLGFMTMATFLAILIGHRVTLAQRLLVKESLGVDQLGGLVRLTIGIVIVATGIQLLGFIALFSRLYFLYPVPEAVWQAAFHAVSGFNNAGFVAFTEPGGLMNFRTDEAIIGVIGLLTFLGGMGYLVMADVARFRRFSLWTLNTKLVLIFTAVLVVIAAMGFLSMEYQNPRTLGPLSVEEKVIDSVFQSIASRTAGFATVDFGATQQQTNFFFTSLMFIGGASASVAGGIKINTFALVVVAVVSAIRGRAHAIAFGRQVPQEQVRRAMVIGAVATGFVFVVALALTFSEKGFMFIDLFFESVSAFGTVGLSTGLTPDLSAGGRLILIVAMFVGRLGPLTIGLAMAQRVEVETYRYPQERIIMG